MGSSRSISSHCDPKTLVAIDLAFDGAWDVLETRDLLARLANDRELHAELSQRLAVLASDGVIDPDELRRQVLASFPLA
jgi:hypothetical protein